MLGFIFMVVNQKSMMLSLDLTTQFSWLIEEFTIFIFINMNMKEMFFNKVELLLFQIKFTCLEQKNANRQTHILLHFCFCI